MKAAELRRLLEERGLAPRHRLGQNFLVDPALLQAIPRDAGVTHGERVLEVGPGAGALTEVLLAAGAAVLAVEYDKGLAALLRELQAAALELPAGEPGSLQLLEGDVLGPGERFHPGVEDWWAAGSAPRLVSNLPYSISGPFLGRLPARPLLGACLLLQAEVAAKAAALAGQADNGPLAVRLGLGFQVRVGRKVPPEVFWPRPQVGSAFLHLEPRAGAPGAAEDRALAELLRLGFQQRRKQLLPRLARLPAAAEALQRAGVQPADRPEAVPPEAWRAAAQALMLQGQSPPDSH